MAYSAPELLLVGAAQNLVLAGSGAQNEAGSCQWVEAEDNFPFNYDFGGLW